MHKRRSLLGAAALALGMLAAGASLAQQKPLSKVHLIWFSPDPVVSIAKVRGLFAAEGIEMQITRTASSTQQMGGLSKGTYDIASTAFDNVLAWSGREGADIVAVSQTSDTVFLPLFVRPEIKTLAELKGKKLAVDAVDTAFALVLRRILLVNGLDLRRGDYELVPAGAPAQRLESMRRGDTFAGIINAPTDAQATTAGLVRIHYPEETILQGYPGGVMSVTRAWSEAHRNELIGFLRAYRTSIAWIWNPANRDEALRLFAADAQLTPELAAPFMGRVPKDGALNMAGAKTVLDLRNELASPPRKGPVLDAYVDPGFFKAAAPR